MSENKDSSADTSGSSGSTGGNIWLSERSAPKKPDSYFKETFEPSSDSGAPSISVYIDYARLSELGNNSDSSGTNDATSSKRSSLEEKNGINESNNRTLAIKKSYRDLHEPVFQDNSSFRFQSPNTPRLPELKNLSSDTVNTNVLMDSRKASLNAATYNILDTSLQDKQVESSEEGLPLRPFKHVPLQQNRDSKKTISTSILDASSIRRLSELEKPDARSSAVLSEEDDGGVITESHSYQAQSKIIEESEAESSEYEKHSKPSIEEAVKLFKQEAKSQPPARLVEHKLTPPHSRAVTTRASQGSLRSQVSQDSRFSQTRRSRKGPQNPSLLASILVAPSSKKRRSEVPNKNVSPAIPALREVSGSSNGSKSSAHPKDQNNPVAEVLQPRQPPKAPYRDQEDMLGPIYRYRDILNEKEVEKDVLYSQFIESSSISSRDSSLGKFAEVFSIPRIMLFLLLCAVAPPAYFITGLNPRNALPDDKLMRLIMNREYREGLFAGFVWDVNLHWFRRTCLLIGTMEVLAIIACIGVGFGVGLSRE
ncbi:LAQU0S06e03928g1_1 [Lachancea quebecensis]|uniref:LAQU0S06e03928g1_1 n=1 Tax=Lachancea quebecensis TaxID=1654605 RepID=A0A0N7MLM4_9SACH|nr:LAQU0S06e03928g1_1 [Lachancea quebecensis]